MTRQICMDDSPPDPKSLVQQAHLYIRRNEPDRAIDSLTQAIDADPTDADLYFLRANAHAGHGQFAAAADDFSATIGLRPDFAAAHHNLGMAHADLGQRQRRHRGFHRGNPTRAEGPGPAQRPRGRLRPARGLCHRHRRLQCRDRTRSVGAARLVQPGQCLGRDRRDRKALADYDAAIDRHPQFARAYLYRGLLHSRGGDADAAIRDYSTALRLDTQLSEAFFHRGRAHTDLGDKSAAVADPSLCLPWNREMPRR